MTDEKQKPVNENYRNNWDAIFKKQKRELEEKEFND